MAIKTISCSSWKKRVTPIRYVGLARRLLLLLCVGSAIVILLGGAVRAAEDGGPIRIEADSMESNLKGASVLFSGNVQATQGDMVINADEMTVYYQALDGGQPGFDAQKIQKLYARGNVRINQEGWMASGNEVDYFSEERKAVLTGNTKVWQDNSMVSGDRIIMYLDEGKSVVERDGGDRVKGIFYPESGK